MTFFTHMHTNNTNHIITAQLQKHVSSSQPKRKKIVRQRTGGLAKNLDPLPLTPQSSVANNLNDASQKQPLSTLDPHTGKEGKAKC